MNITELDESQGLTVEMLHSWLLSHGWRLAACEQGCGKELVSPSNRRCNVLRSLEDFPWSWALIETRMTAQALLREINPRMRKGMPSEAARIAHPLGLWLAMPDFDCIGAKVSIVVSLSPDDADSGMWHPEGFCFADTKPKRPDLWMFWPCDEHGNKVRWPTDEEGNML